MAKTHKPGHTAPRSGEYEIRGPRAGDAGKERHHHPGSLVTKSGRTIITSPAKSTNSVNSWSKAFKK
jgi:hypothetical protein